MENIINQYIISQIYCALLNLKKHIIIDLMVNNYVLI